jgi:hypothetical protein
MVILRQHSSRGILQAEAHNPARWRQPAKHATKSFSAEPAPRRSRYRNNHAVTIGQMYAGEREGTPQWAYAQENLSSRRIQPPMAGLIQEAPNLRVFFFKRMQLDA